ncbi:hypothetical protein CBL_01433 [Carabus blaptoides fortunei]
MQAFAITLLLCVATALGNRNVEVKPVYTTETNLLENSVDGDENQFSDGHVATDIPPSETPTIGPISTGCFSQSVDENGEKVPHIETTSLPLAFDVHHTQHPPVPQQFHAHSHRYNGFSSAHPYPMHHQMPVHSFGLQPPQSNWANRFSYQPMAFQSFGPQPFWANRFPYQRMAFQSFGTQPPQPFWANRFPYHPMAFQSFGSQPHQPFWANRFPYHPMAFQSFGAQPHQPFWANRFPYHSMAFQSFAPQSTWFNRFNGFDMQRPMPYMMPPFQRFGLSHAQSNPMHPLVIVKLLQPIIVPIVKKEEEKNTPKGEIDIDTERITNNGPGFSRFGQGFNRFGQSHNKFGQGFNRFTQGVNGFGQGFNRFGQFNNMGQGLTTFGSGMNRVGQSFNRFGQDNNNFGRGTNRIGTNGFQLQKLRSSGPVPFRQNAFGPLRMNEDQNLHITVKLN